MKLYEFLFPYGALKNICIRINKLVPLPPSLKKKLQNLSTKFPQCSIANRYNDLLLKKSNNYPRLDIEELKNKS